MVPICLITGFLGSGKTTLLQHIVETHRDEKIVYLFNEYSPRDIDGAMLAQAEDDVVAIPGGSIFCRCLVTQFVGHLQRIPERFHSDEHPLAGVVIEASGVANPMVIEQMLAETGLDEVYALSSIISVVEPGSLPKLVHTLPNIRAQIEAADTVLVNKIDLFPPEDIDATEQIVREINPQATVMRTVHCAVDLELFAGARVRGLEGDYALCADPNYARYAISFAQPVEIDALRARLEALSDEIYRAKGVVPTPDGPVYLDMSASGIITEKANGTPAGTGLVIIAHGEDSGGVGALVADYGGEKAD